jgi:hypothetical protein
MTKLSWRTVDGWPVMNPLGQKESDLLRRNLVPGERVLGQVIANFGQAIIATDHKVLIIKTGLMAGATFGGKATSFDYRTMVGVEVRSGFTHGEFELIAAGLSAPQGSRSRDKRRIEESPNGVVFPATSSRIFDKMATKIREMTAAAHGSGVAVNPQPAASAPSASIPDQIRALSDLHASGILTDDEFSTKKAELLSRL